MENKDYSESNKSNTAEWESRSGRIVTAGEQSLSPWQSGAIFSLFPGVKVCASVVLMAVLTVIVALPASPRYTSFPGRDAGVFLYTGNRILQGDIPYRDAWDHKAPAIYYFNALGLWLGQGSLWGVWLVELIVWLGAVAACLWLLYQAFSLRIALIGTSAFLCGIVLVLQGGSLKSDRFLTGSYSATNLTESYVLGFQFACLALMFSAERKNQYGLRGILIGCLGSICFLLRPNLIAIPVAISISILLFSVVNRDWKKLTRAGVSIGAGACLTVSVVLAFFAFNGALSDFLDAVFHYNAAYVQHGSESPAQGVRLGYALINQSGLGLLAVMGIVAGVAMLRGGWRNCRGRLVLTVLIAIPLEIILSTMSGRSFPHYYLSWLPLIALLVSFAACVVDVGLIGVTRRATQWYVLLMPTLIVIVLGVSIIPTLKNLQFERSTATQESKLKIASYIKENTEDGDLVLIWGAESSMNFMSGREAPTRYVYQYPLFMSDYQSSEIIDSFLRELEATPPRLIIDASGSTSAIPALDHCSPNQEEDARYKTLPETCSIYDFVGVNYEISDTLMAPGDIVWTVYQHNTDPSD